MAHLCREPLTSDSGITVAQSCVPSRVSLTAVALASSAGSSKQSQSLLRELENSSVQAVGCGPLIQNGHALPLHVRHGFLAFEVAEEGHQISTVQLHTLSLWRRRIYCRQRRVTLLLVPNDRSRRQATFALCNDTM